jgi:formylmethanofuran--tetrahydromethanopterin N-formyltransferase
MKINGSEIIDTFAEGFRMVFTRLIVTAIDPHWAGVAAKEMCGYGTSVIGCDAEAGVESVLSVDETPDGRPGVSLLLFGFSPEALAVAVCNRVGQCAMTCPTTAVYGGLESETSFPLGRRLRFFGDGFQHSKLLGTKRYWRIPVMDGEFVCADTVCIAKGVAGGNFLIQSIDQRSGLAAAMRAVSRIDSIEGVITPFPGGVVRSGSKVGSRYEALRASTANAWCPTLRARTDSAVADGANCVYEIVIDGVDEVAVNTAMIAGIRAAAGEGVVAIAAGNYGGKLGKFHFHLHKLLNAD